MPLPKQIQEQADAVAKMEQQLQGEVNPTPAPENPDPAPPSDPAPVAAPEAAQPENQPAPEPNLEAELKLWKSRYDGLKGIFKVQGEQVEQLKGTVSELTSKIEELLSKANTPETQKTELPAGVTANDIDQFGPDLVDLARRIAREEWASREATLKDEIGRLKSELTESKKAVTQVAETQVQTAQQRFFADLGTALPNWQEVQASTECQAWLGTAVPGTQFTWDAVLKDAASRANVADVLAVFNTFIAQHPQFAPRQAQPNRAKTELAQQVSPANTRANATTPQGEQRIYSGADFEAESMRVIRFSQQGRHEEAAQLQAQLDKALTEGRVR